MNMDAKIPQQDTRKTNLETYKNNYTLWPKEIYPKMQAWFNILKPGIP